MILSDKQKFKLGGHYRTQVRLVAGGQMRGVVESGAAIDAAGRYRLV
jgi:hypothetical protein